MDNIDPMGTNIGHSNKSVDMQTYRTSSFEGDIFPQ